MSCIKKKYIEGRKNNLFLSKALTKNTGNVGLKSTYVKNKSFDDEYFRRRIVQYIEKFGAASRREIDELLMNKLSDVLSAEQKKNKIKNLLYALAKSNVIKLNEKRQWVFDTRGLAPVSQVILPIAVMWLGFFVLICNFFPKSLVIS